MRFHERLVNGRIRSMGALDEAKNKVDGWKREGKHKEADLGVWSCLREGQGIKPERAPHRIHET
jgi:hypothetical protein